MRLHFAKEQRFSARMAMFPNMEALPRALDIVDVWR
ncbi:hypothetical protein X743_09940 [Mesorhizobium sp. LNHC252B00]|nr:hypothetical protein X743_09940 [Mesorhizobium sp. LNHC252B00]